MYLLWCRDLILLWGRRLPGHMLSYSRYDIDQPSVGWRIMTKAKDHGDSTGLSFYMNAISFQNTNSFWITC